VGFIDEPAGMVQAAHLLEHLVCYTPVAGIDGGDSLAWLNRRGMGNAETLPDFTHYDSAAPAEQLERLLEIETSRWRDFVCDRATVEREAHRCYLETDAVEANPATGMCKHALMALSHAWRFRAARAPVRSGMESFDLEALREYHRQYYVPHRMAIAISGDIDVPSARRLLEKTLVSVPARHEAAMPTAIDWDRVPVEHTVRWDARCRGVAIAWPAPGDATEQVIASLLGMMAWESLNGDADLSVRCHAHLCSNNLWRVGRVPIFVYAALKEDAEPAPVAALLAERFTNAMHIAARRQLAHIKSYVVQQHAARLTPARVRQMLPMLTGQGHAPDRAMQMILLQDALTTLTMYHLLGTDRDGVIGRIRETTPEEASAMVARWLEPGLQRRTVILPD
jgi:hypothetical protein